LNYSIQIFDVGHADSIVVTTPGGKTCIVDCAKKGERIPIIEYLSNHSINEIEFICLTHYHEDHYSGIIELLQYCHNNNVTIKYFYDSGLSPKEMDIEFRQHDEKTYYLDMRKLIYGFHDNRQFILRECHEGTVLLQEDGFVIRALLPDTRTTRDIQSIKCRFRDRNLNGYLNHFSIVLLILSNLNSLLLSDAETRGQRIILDRNSLKGSISFIKLSHHGSKENYHIPLIDQCFSKSNRYAAISTGCRYGTPSCTIPLHSRSNNINLYSTNFVDCDELTEYPDLSLMEAGEISQEMLDGLLNLTGPVTEPMKLIPYHGDISIELTNSTVVVTTQYQRPAI
jgi:beta-lactamase superfamily II metal-dependent hydrolase